MENYPVTDNPQQIIRDTFGCSLHPSLGNTALSFSPSFGDTIELVSAPTPNLTITLPETLAEDAGIATQPSLAFCGYKTETLFVRRDSYLQASGRGSLQLTSGVVSARPAMTERITDLTENVKMTFMKNQVSEACMVLDNGHPCDAIQESSGSKCSYWEQSLDDGYGGWSEEGCELIRENGDEVVCECNHLTNFAILSGTAAVEAEASIQRYTIIGATFALLCVLIVLIGVAITR